MKDCIFKLKSFLYYIFDSCFFFRQNLVRANFAFLEGLSKAEAKSGSASRRHWYFRLMIGGIADEPYYLEMCEDAGIWRSGGGDRQMPAELHWIFYFKGLIP